MVTFKLRQKVCSAQVNWGEYNFRQRKELGQNSHRPLQCGWTNSFVFLCALQVLDRKGGGACEGRLDYAVPC